ncbi:outer membrane protein assembly factor BamD [Candidatus Vallotia lariciata]|uniref:outer membrane protein assembly factor BamD n=1 Tax=Candidatus Vallotia laricis TaxID=2018052 RepID=UPI001D00585A|nr:outer membrane protein assembly factor BamD [Candidatus Vallotia lariciata]UDG83097.1 Outer membrane protein assembly factor BamD [Candidatus Vallotia lariciata]
MRVLNILRIAAITITTVIVTGCYSFPEKIDEMAGWTNQELYLEARNAFTSSDWSRCSKYFKLLEERDPFGSFAQQAQINIPYCQWKDNEKEAAKQSADRFIQLYPDHPDIAYVYYLKGLIGFNNDQSLLDYFIAQNIVEYDPEMLHNAYDSFRIIVEKYPRSKYALDATQRMRYIANVLAEHEVNTADYYYRRGAYVAAINRAQIVLKKYKNTTATEDALHIMVLAYRKLQQKQLADDAQRVLILTFPDSVYVTGRTHTLSK